MAYTSAVRSLGNLSSATTTTAVALEGNSSHYAAIIIRGTWNATVEVQVSHNGTSWVTAKDVAGNEVSGITSTRCVVITGNVTHIRCEATAYTSGTVAFRMIPLAG